MINNLTSCVNATHSRTRIFAFLIDTAFVERTISTATTFGTAIRWTSNVSGYASTNCHIVDFTALRIWTTRRWLARVSYWFWENLYSCASFKSISSIAFNTRTAWWMIDYTAQSVRTTDARTWVATFGVDASLIGRTFAVHYAFWSTWYIGVAVIVRKTCTRSSVIQFFTDSIDTTRISGAGCFVRW